MIDRDAAVRLINTQFEEVEPKDSFRKIPHWRTNLPHHYGRCELRSLIDAIYGPPKEGDELIQGDDFP